MPMTHPVVHRPATVDELAALLDDLPSVELLAGGTLAIPIWQERGVPDQVVYLPSIAALRAQGENWCGAAVSLSELASKQGTPRALREAATSIAGPAVRNLATVGGNIAGVQAVWPPPFSFSMRSWIA